MPVLDHWVFLLPFPDLPLPAMLAATVLGAGLVEPLRAGLAVAMAFPVIVLIGRVDRAVLTLLAVAGISALGWWASNVWEAGTGAADDRRIVIDEVAGALLGTVVARPPTLPLSAAFVVAFLSLDRLKPWPFSELERLPGAWGIMADDLVIGAALGFALRSLGRLFR